MMNHDPSSVTVVVGMSGGVDSSVAALLLKQQGYRVIGVFMKNWEEDDVGGHCTAQEDLDDVSRVCDALGIPFYSVNFAKEYWDRVFSRCLEEYRAGHTPNPDILCNAEIKFRVFFDKAIELGADYLATGHYCRRIQRNGKWLLGRGMDANKDQSYFLYGIDGSVLDRVLFPIGELEKSRVRAIAHEHGLVTASKKDSTGICFIGKRNFREFLSDYITPNPGHFETVDGRVVGQHQGVAFYTIGQRRGLAIGGPGEAWYVLDKDIPRNVVIVDQGEQHEGLFAPALTATDMHWIVDEPVLPLRCTAKIRYRQDDVACTIEPGEAGRIWVAFDEPQRAITPRQSIVFYDGDVCLGGAMIHRAESASLT